MKDMLLLWWPAFLVPALMLLGCVLPGVHYISPFDRLDSEMQAFADHQQRQLLWRIGLAFAALSFMTMQSVRLMPLSGQKWLVCGLMILQAIGELLLTLPIEKAIAQEFNEKRSDNEGDPT